MNEYIATERPKVLHVLHGFFQEMKRWEEKGYVEMEEVFSLEGIDQFLEKDAEVNKQSQTEIKAIFLKYCTLKDRKQGRPNKLWWTKESDYGVENNPICKIDFRTKKRAELVTQPLSRSNFSVSPVCTKHRFTLLYKKDGWRIDKKEFLIDEINWLTTSDFNYPDQDWGKDFL